MSEPLFEFLGVTVTVTGAYAVFSVLTLILSRIASAHAVSYRPARSSSFPQRSQ